MEKNESVVIKQEEVTKQTLYRYMKIILWVSVILFVVAVISMLRAIQLQESVEELDDHTISLSEQTKEARLAAVQARDTLQKALDDSERRRQEGESASPQAIVEALSAIDRIENYLCGGRCEGTPGGGN